MAAIAAHCDPCSPVWSRTEGLRVFRTKSTVSLRHNQARRGQEACREEEAILRRADHRRTAASRPRGPHRDLCRKVGISEQSFYRWKKEYGNLQPSEARELKQLRDENTKLTRLVADLSLDKIMLQDIVQKKF